jgi:hypothetical protein
VILHEVWFSSLGRTLKWQRKGNQRATPQVFAKVETVAADLVTNPQTGEVWYSIRTRRWRCSET